MAHTAIAIFTSENLATIIHQAGSQAWHINATRAREREYLVCAQNREHPGFREPGAPHRAAFLVGRIAGVVPSSIRPERWFIQLSEYGKLEIIDFWQQRNPIRYTTLEALGIDLANLPPLRPLPRPPVGLGEVSAAPVLLLGPRQQPRSGRRTAAPDEASSAGGRDTRDRFDAILSQIDRIPDLPVPFDPLAWDAHGLPR